MAKLEQLVTPLELLAAIRGGALKSDILKQYRTNDQEVAVMLQPLYRTGKMTKDEFNDFFRGLSLKPPEPPAGEAAVAEQKAEPALAPEPVAVPAAEPPTHVEAAAKAPTPIEQGPVPGLEHLPAELERAVDQAPVEEAVPKAAASRVPAKPAPEPKAKPAAPPEPKPRLEPKPKPEPKAKPQPKQQKEQAGIPREATPKTESAPPKTVPVPLKAVPAPPADVRAEETKVRPGVKGVAEKPKEDATLDLITVTVEEPLLPILEESAVATVQSEETLRTILSRLDSIDARLSRIEKKLETD